MKTIAIEEHFAMPAAVGSPLPAGAPVEGDMLAAYTREQGGRTALLGEKVRDLGPGRLADMDAAGIAMQVLQFSGLALDRMDRAAATALARDANDLLAEAIGRHPERFSGLAALNLQDPEGAAAELERAVTRLGLRGGAWSGRCCGHFLDHPRFDPVWAAAQRLGVPIYLHPGAPGPELVQALYSDLPAGLAGTLACAGWGWHMECGYHALHLVLSGLFDRFPKAQCILGHMGEGLPFALSRANTWLTPLATHLEQSVEEYFLSNFYLTTSGFFSIPTLLCAVMVWGIDRVIFAVDYPYSSSEEGHAFLEALPLSAADREKIAHGNAERLLKL